MKTFTTQKLLSIALPLLMAFSFSVKAEEKNAAPESEFEVVLPDQQKLKKEEEANTKLLLANILKKAKGLQDSYGDFAPFGAALFPNGRIQYVWLAKPGETVNDPAKALPIVRGVLEQSAKKGLIIGSAVAYKYGAAESPQLNVELEYLSGYAKIVGTEMQVDGEGKVKWGKAGQQDFESQVFFLDRVEAPKE